MSKMIIPIFGIIGMWVSGANALGSCGLSPNVATCSEDEMCVTVSPDGPNRFQCTKVCLASKCNNHVDLMTFRNSPTNCEQVEPYSCSITAAIECECTTCSQGWAGVTCEKCAIGYSGATCAPICTIPADCSNHADKVVYVEGSGTCTCTCSDSYSGADCSICESKFDQNNCNKCAELFISYPTCSQCTNVDSCNGHAASVSTDALQTQCLCSCVSKFKGDTCDTCAVGYITYPTCTECTSIDHCTNRATAVDSNSANTKCVCTTCRNSYSGDQCETCKTKYGGSDCDECAVKHINYPTCTQCTAAAHCSNHADSVTSDAMKQNCDCTCRNQWKGATCDTCDVKFAGDCDACAAGYIGPFPNCVQCTEGTHCSNHASAVSDDGTRTTCSCTCNDGFEGADCSGCAATHINYPTCTKCTSADHCNGNAKSVADDMRTTCVCTCKGKFEGSTCDSCKADHINYPTCTQCTAAAHCSNHADNVTSDAMKQNCDCTCRNQWKGATCDTCDVKFGGDCDACAVGYIGPFPNCVQCTEGTHCSNHASAVSDDGTRTTCSCTCNDGFEGADCSGCAATHINYPTCTKCTSADHCNGNAKSVADDMRTTCVCTCKGKFEGSTCDSCKADHINYPTCTQCTVGAHCSNHADSVTSDAMKQNCDCTCRNQWKGATCDTCDVKFGGDCDACAVGYIGPFPNCVQCTEGTHCSNHASAVSDDGTRTTCSCTCNDGFEGADCSGCAATHINYPTCTKCTSADHCNGNAKSVADDMRTTCVCTCKDGFEGSACNNCLANHINYPTCTQCTVKAHCSNHADSVVADSMQQNCDCTCRNQWKGATCDTCDVKFGGDCDACAAGYIGPFPNCVQCTEGTHCSNHASAVSDDGTRTTCSCTCNDGFEGADCSGCAATHINYPTCTKCTSADHCNGNAKSVADDMRTTCVCTCKGKFEGSTCDSCKADHINYPTCTQCTVGAHCSNHADNVTSDAMKQNCDCTCRNQWKGATCDTCDVKFGGDCDACAVGYIGPFPNCVQCTEGTHCSNHASAVSDDGTRTTCSCTCNDGFEGADCSGCAATHINYPTCTKCTSADHCNGNAKSVADDMRTTCVCTCKGKFEGSTCDSCKADHINYPTCTQCTVGAHCSNHADNVTSDAMKQNCDCTCRNQWKGATCDTCDVKFGGDCDACAAGYIGPFPNCVQCTEGTHCSNHASAVSDDGTRTTCSCTCDSPWTGSDCSVCPVNFGGTNCDKCADGLFGYPNCLPCTPSDACNSHADSAKVESDKCVCECSNKWSGPTCAICDGLFGGVNCDMCIANHINFPTCTECTAAVHCNNNAASVVDINRATCNCTCKAGFDEADCGVCAANHTGYPICSECTIAGNCSGNANTVVDVNKLTCQCDCRNQWKGATCDICDAKFDNDCGACAPGYIKPFPQCVQCNTTTHCSNHANTVTDNGDRSTCVCDCRNKWTGDQCQTCPPTYAGADCDECAAGAIGYPGCGNCDNATDCNGHAATVSVNKTTDSCVCQCLTQFEGATCDKCSSNHINYPTCTPCDNTNHCNGNAQLVSDNGMRTGCTCDCRNKWTGTTCDTCPSQYGGSDCDECAVGRIGYDTCTECTVRNHCSNHATSVTDDGTRTTCKCTCDNGWSGDQCQTCESKYDNSNNLCDSCAVGHINFPTCTQCDFTLCGGKASSISDNGNRTSCLCQCNNQWTGPTCTTCPSKFAGSNCNKCAADRVNYPSCDVCDITTHCGGNAVSVSPDATQTTCNCTCKDSWTSPTTGTQCTVCPTKFDQTTCSSCASGYFGYPGCTKCDVATGCSNHATAAIVLGDVCTCNCTDQWTGATCDLCDAKFDQNTCDRCANGFIDYPNCVQCDNSLHCSGNGVAKSNALNTECTCDCSNSWTHQMGKCDFCDPAKYSGATCNACAQGLKDYPLCGDICHISMCGGANKASAVVYNTVTAACDCTCSNQYTGANCSVCDSKFAGLCDGCATGYINYPTCDVCTNAIHCSGNAVSVTSNLLNTGCQCLCNNSFSGLTCDSCPPGMDLATCSKCADGWMGVAPQCTQCSNAIHCNGNAANITSSATSCTCSCKNQFTGSNCNQCPDNFFGSQCDGCAGGFINYPFCTPACTLQGNCTVGHASSVEWMTPNDCICNCTDNWEGANCSTCPFLFSGINCDTCSDERINYPTCTQCSVDLHCSGNADSVEKLNDYTCGCNCSAQWTGPECGVCPAKYGGVKCDTCADGHIDYPNCYECSIIADCSSRATAVSTDVLKTKCTCDCLNAWTGETCDTCPKLYRGANCNECIVGFDGYPTCGQGCTIPGNCSGNAIEVEHVNDFCNCTCTNKWTADDCSVCPDPYEGIYCDQCQEGYIGYPECTMCSVTEHCNDHAVNVTDDGLRQTCVCNCQDQWSGDSCDQCDRMLFDESCSKCIPSLVDYPTCRDCYISEDCNDRAVEVVVVNGTCQCGCVAKWEGFACEICPEVFEQTTCSSCAVGTMGVYPYCYFSRTKTLTLTLTEFKNATETLDDGSLLGAHEFEEDDESCWKPFVGWCFWLVVSLATACSIIIAGLAYRYRRRGEQSPYVGDDAFDKYAEMAEANPDMIFESEAPEGDYNFRDEAKFTSSVGEGGLLENEHSLPRSDGLADVPPDNTPPFDVQRLEV